MKVGAISVELDGDAGALEAASARAAAALLKVKKSGEDLAAALLRTSKAEQNAEENSLRLLTAVEQTALKIDHLRTRQVALAQALATADGATRSNTAHMLALKHELEQTTAQLNKFTGQGVRQMTAALNQSATPLLTTNERLKVMHSHAMRGAGAISAMAGALSASGSHVGQFVSGLANIAGAFVMGGPLLGGIALLGAGLAAAISYFDGMDAAAKKATASAQQDVQKLSAEVDTLGVKLLSLQSGISVDVISAENAVATAKANPAFGSRGAEGFRRLVHLTGGRQDMSGMPEADWDAAVTALKNLNEATAKLKGINDNDAAERTKEALNAWDQRNKMVAAAAIERARADRELRDLAEVNRLLAGIDMDRELGTPDRVPFSGLGEISVDELNAELGITKDVMGDVVFDLDAYNKKLQDQAAAVEAAKSAQRARFEGAASMVGGSLMSGTMSVDTLGTAIGMAAGGPMGAAVGSSIAGMAQEIASLIGGGVSKVFGGAGDKVMGSAQTGAMGALPLAGFAFLPVIGPIIATLGTALAFLGGTVLDLSTKTEAFANLSKVAGMALEVLIDPLGMIWSALYPVAGAFMQIALALAPLLSIVMMMLPLEPVVWVLVEAMKLASISMLSVVAGFAGAAKGLIELLEDATGLDLPGNKKLGDVEDAARDAIEDIEGITVETGMDAFWDAINANTEELRTFNDTLTNIPSGYRVPYYDASDPGSHPGSGGGGGVNRGVGRGPKDPSRNSRTGNNVSVQQLTIVARDTSIFDAIHREAQRRFGTNRGIGGGLPDEEN